MQGPPQEFAPRRASGRFHLRYEDVAQDGRVRADILPSALGAVWREMSVSSEIEKNMRRTATIPLLTRLDVEVGDGTFAVTNALQVEGGYALSSSRDRDGNIDKIILDMDATVSGPIGRTNLPAPDDAGTPAIVGRIQAEHVFTRPFAPPAERKVRSLPFADGGFVPAAERAWVPAAKLLDLPEGAKKLDGGLRDDPVAIVTGLAHTDSNQHVNSAVYPRLFEEVALRRFAELGRSATVLARRIEIGYRRPSFAGETLRVALQAFEHEGRVGCTGVFYSASGESMDKPRVCVRMTFG